MKGSVRKRGKTWSYYFDLGIIDGKRKKVEKGGFTRKGDAEKALNQAINDFENGGFVAPQKTIFIQVANEWLENYIKPLRKISTYNRYKELTKKYLADSIGNMDIAKIQAYHIEQLLLKSKNDISSSTLQGIYTLINTIMNRALKLKLIKDNPCKYVERPKRKKVIYDTLSANEARKALSVLDLNNYYDYMFSIAFRIDLELGLRRGEIGGLEWKDVDFINNTITINNNLIYSNGHVYLVSPKTDESNRQIYVSKQILDLLKELQTKEKFNKLKYGEFYIRKNMFADKNGIEHGYDLIMVWQDGKYIHPMYYTNKIKKVLKKANIDKDTRFHDIRHTNATLLISQGINLKVIQERLGHKDFSTTTNIYSHVTKKMQEEATDELSKILNE